MAKSINLTSSIRKIADAIKLNDIVYFVYRATANKVCLAIQPDESHVHAYGRKWLTWDYVLRTSNLSDSQKTRINGLLKDFIGQSRVSEPAKISPKSPNTKKQVSKNTGVIQTPKSEISNKSNLRTCEPTGTWRCDGKVAISPKNREWSVVTETNNGWVIMSKSSLVAFLTREMKYRSL